ncbi:MAG: carbohydrate ABC transporter substrate-binding protein [Candidatus Lokiarchaeota archaeon]|nr:carbohydrate ABC transporter substrate-binding protein [Candidatus Lokiarchaeota archaeon]
MDPKKQTIIIVLVAVLATAGIAIGVTYVLVAPPPEGETDALEIYHWWTSGGEAAAVGALVDVFKGLYPDTIVTQLAVAGGSGTTMIPIITSLVLAGEAPDAFQMHAGYEGIEYFKADLLDNINDIWADNNLETVIPDVVQSMCQFDGDYYMVPVNIHRSNVVWYNLKELESVAVDPKTLTNWTAFFDACDDWEAANSGKDAISLGEAWTQAHLFEQILAGEGIDVYEAWINGDIISGTDPDLLAALTILETYMTYTNIDFDALTWDAATDLLIQNNSIFNVMGDWANGEFLLVNSVYDDDYGTIAVPGTGDMYGLVVDAFQHPAGVAHPRNSDRWLEVVASKEGQDAFNPLKGSISARTDSDLTLYGPYHDWTFADFESVTYMFPSVVHGSGAPQSFSSELGSVINAFCTGAATKAATAIAIAALASSNAADFTTVWSLD